MIDALKIISAIMYCIHVFYLSLYDLMLYLPVFSPVVLSVFSSNFITVNSMKNFEQRITLCKATF